MSGATSAAGQCRRLDHAKDAAFYWSKHICGKQYQHMKTAFGPWDDAGMLAQRLRYRMRCCSF